jgi:hypothetical protein
MTIAIDFGPLADTATPEALARVEERRELFRIAGQCPHSTAAAEAAISTRTPAVGRCTGPG